MLKHLLGNVVVPGLLSLDKTYNEEKKKGSLD